MSRPEAQTHSVLAVRFFDGLFHASGVKAHRRVLLEVGHRESGRGRCHDDFGETVRVLGRGPCNVRVAIGVRAGTAIDVAAIEGVREIEHEGIEAVNHREQWMKFDEHERASGAQYSRDTVHPRVQVVDPAQDADRGVHEVEAAVEFVG